MDKDLSRLSLSVQSDNGFLSEHAADTESEEEFSKSGDESRKKVRGIAAAQVKE